ncbi:hypothetical protein Dvina_33890 [Dactylosporangium vinaceum]|uniref:PH domain-containing protein n=1 Tax=Dactylosporangium vinaceum TaxID=53362 RepID=A0ABV5MMH5_9ACTN|nr:hypothetical protein [Dactylosporangium vinaceum]UAB93247.1 hypothetical protein Dvina_33890 [Dactylosporangium vinaceum]
MSQGANGDDNLGRRNAWLYYVLVGGAGIVLWPLNIVLHNEVWPQAVTLVLCLGNAVAYIAATLRTRRPRTLSVRPGAFEAPPSYLRLALQAAGMPLAVALLFSVVYDDDDWGVYTWMLFAAAVAAIYLTGHSLAMLIRGTGRLTLRPDGLTVVDATVTHDVPWEAILSGPLPTVFGMGRVGILWPELVTSRGLGRKKNLQRIALQLQPSAVDREFLHSAINHYLNQPEERAAIGTAEGLRQLQAAEAV